ncbi:MAG: DUF1667 domain-containing protein [Candidatus Omnitrophota bacterium]
MIKNLTCIECPIGCSLKVGIENCKVVKVEGNKCPKGEPYAISEIEAPVRILTTSVRAKGLSIKMMPVRTDKPIPKAKLMEAMKEIKKIVIKTPLSCGDIIVKGFMGLDIDLVATRDSA